MAIKVTKFRAMDKGVLQGFLGVEWSFFVQKQDGTYHPLAIEINNIALFDSEKGRGIGLPNQTYEKRDGGRGRDYHVYIPNEAVRDAFQKQVLAALDQYLAENPDKAQAQSSGGVSDNDIPF